MKYVDEYRDGDAAQRYVKAIAAITARRWTIMEICGGQTHAIVKFGLDELLPPSVTLVHGPGCPVCVTPAEIVDEAIELAGRPGVIFCSFGDMLRVPGSGRTDLQSVKAAGGDIRIVYSPLDAVAVAQKHPDREVVFFAIGFETTAPANAMAAYRAKREGLRNFSLLVSQVLVPPAIEAILSAPSNRVQGLLAAGHVCAVMGYTEYEPIAAKYGVPIVVTGFEPVDILQGLYLCLRALEEGRREVENAYSRVVNREGNPAAQRVMGEVFDVVDRNWRGIGVIPRSGLGLSEAYRDFDAERRFALTPPPPVDVSGCISGLVLQGVKRPFECPSFGTLCTPEHPLGAPMVSSEGACSAYYQHRRQGRR
jgi:hydrogenase expression/formation protein HypD